VPCGWREYHSLQSKPTGKAARFVCRVDRLLILEIAENGASRHICGQIIRSGTSAAANYGEARGAESRADFVHKLKIVFKELNETTIWLEIIGESSSLSPEHIAEIVRENRELCRIIAASIKTARMASD